ncbi:MAG: hypothetical protein AB7I27_03960 [Bacteriovoracaceae bacterium]
MRLVNFNLFFIFLSLPTFAALEVDRRDTIDGVSLTSGKTDGVRTYLASWNRKFPYPVHVLKNSITNFTERCNNKYKDKRKFSDKNKNCKYNNEHMIESFIITNLKDGMPKLPGEVERMVVGRQIYNRGSYGYYELVQILEGLNNEGKKTVTIVEQMLSDDEVKKLIEPKFDKESAFLKSANKYTMIELSPNETQVFYEFEAQTDHWVLNKEVSVPQVFSSIGKSINDLIVAVDTESTVLTREIASKK